MINLKEARNREIKHIEFLIEELMFYYNPYFIEEIWQSTNSFCQYTYDRRPDKTSFDYSCNGCPIFKAEKKKCYETDWHKRIRKAIFEGYEKPIPLLLAYKMWIEGYE